MWGKGGLGSAQWALALGMSRNSRSPPFPGIPAFNSPFTQVVKEFLIPKSYKHNSSFPGIEVGNQIGNGQGMTNPFLILGHR